MNRYEKLIEYIINGNEKAAQELFHKIVVDRSRTIYEGIVNEEVGGNPSADFVSDISDESEFEDDFASDAGEMSDDEFGDEDEDLGDDDFGDDEGLEDEMDDEDVEDRVMDLKAELDRLKAEFDELMHDVEGSDTDFDDEDEDEFGDEDMDDEFDSEEDGMDSEDEMEDDFGTDDSDSDYEPSEAEIMKEYVDKVKDFYKGEQGEGHEVGTGGSVNVNKKSITDNMKNDMGGTTQNIAKGGSESNPDGQKPDSKARGFVKSPVEHDEGKRNVNKPGGNRGAQKFYNKKAPASKPEGSTTGDKVSVQKDSILKARK